MDMEEEEEASETKLAEVSENEDYEEEEYKTGGNQPTDVNEEEEEYKTEGDQPPVYLALWDQPPVNEEEEEENNTDIKAEEPSIEIKEEMRESETRTEVESETRIEMDQKPFTGDVNEEEEVEKETAEVYKEPSIYLNEVEGEGEWEPEDNGFNQEEEDRKKEELTMEALELFKKRLIEDDRMDSIFRSKQNLTEKFDNRANVHPHGLTDFDYTSIPKSRRQSFEKFKHKTRHENYKYLGEHYELDALYAIFFSKLLVVKPQDAVHFAAEFFTKDTLLSNFQSLLDEEKQKISNYRVKKMKAAGKINVICGIDEEIKKEEVHYKRCFPKNTCKDKPNIGSLALGLLLVPDEKPEPKKKYCGCKDPGRIHISHPKKAPSKSEENPEDEQLDVDIDEEDNDDEIDNQKLVKIKFG